MPIDAQLRKFVEDATKNGVSDLSIVGILTSRGWLEKDVYEALGDHYEHAIGTEIPQRKGGGPAAAKDAFFYLVIFSTLGTWTIELGALAFILIERWFADPLFSHGYAGGYDSSSTASALAGILVAFPIYLLVTRAVILDARLHPEKLQSPVRKWLTYMSLVIAAVIFICDLITILTYFLRGETTSRFLAKALVVLVISGAVFLYYFWGIKKPEVKAALSRDLWAAVLSSAAVAAMVALGFVHMGAPGVQRLLRADERRQTDIAELSQRIQVYWNFHKNTLPQHLDELLGQALSDPITHRPYEYSPREGSQYELCATFSTAGQKQQSQWSHPAGRYCFPMDATKAVDAPYFYRPD